MDAEEILVSLTPMEANGQIKSAIVDGTISGEVIDCYERIIGDNVVIVLVLEKYYFRTKNRCSMTVTIDNFEGTTKVRAVASGSSQGIFLRFDMGAGNSFLQSVIDALDAYRA
jgi:hypothetical protein